MHNIIDAFQAGGYESGADVGKRRRLSYAASSSSSRPKGPGRPTQTGYKEEQTKALRGMAFTEFQRMNCYERHHKMMRDYIMFYGGKPEDLLPKPPSANVMTDFDILKESYRFLPDEADLDDSTWEKRMAKKYYDKLFKEYCVGYLQHYREGKIGMRWRTEKEVVQGKGQFICGNHSCSKTEQLKSYEVNFAYKESGKQKQALVKLRVCPDCAYKLNYKKIKKLEKKIAKSANRREDSDSDTNRSRAKKKKRKKKKSLKRDKKRRRSTS
mmetsp:Transcript_26337/g.46713  ORF Transcript_26337/g.46713 Transcript_26337/m.46713 type:complete len:269 (-) Transcript_26337:41-847(-)